MKYYRRCYRIIKTDKIRNEGIKNGMSIQKDAMFIIEEKRLKWYRDVR